MTLELADWQLDWAWAMRRDVKDGAKMDNAMCGAGMGWGKKAASLGTFLV